jgi:enoyl-CoA hydratase/carnithine racemase
MGEFVRLEVDGGVGVVRLDRPPANAVDHAVGVELGEAVHELGRRVERPVGSDGAVGAVVVWGGPRLFAAGADIKEMAAFGPEEIRPVISAFGDALDEIEALPVVTIAAITGFALGGGLELALACDLRYAAEDAKVGQPEIRIGVIPGAGGTQRLVHLAGPAVARDLIFTGRQVGAAEALSLGLVDRVLPAEDLVEGALEDARAYAAGPREALRRAKAAIRTALDTPLPAGLRRERESFVELFGTPDQREGMRAFLEKREPRFGGDA